MRKALVVAAAAAALWLAPGALASGWCGSGETATDRPDAVTGAQIHAVVATPADAPDQFATVANRLADDVASVSAWWTGQDPTRAPRYDQAAFPGAGTCLDISFVRLPQPASFYQGDSSFGAIGSALSASGFGGIVFKDYLVYYDGPAPSPDVCGTGAGGFNQREGLAIVWLNGCPDVPSDGVQAHELLHAFGALPLGAPNVCTAATDPAGVADNAHPCDSQSDILFPYADGRPLQQEVLDVNRDDYYGHSGTWDDIQDSVFLHHVDTPQVALGVTLSGHGQVTSDLPGVACAGPCTTQWDQGTKVTLSPIPAATSRFIHWTGGCAGKADCGLDLTQAASVTAVFGPLTIPVKISTGGKGTVKCTPACSKRFAAGDRLTLRAVPAKGWRFARWGGACSGTRITCAPKTDYALTARANFTKKR